jgi:hypothetical protein
MSLKSARLPSRLPAGSKYILESRGTMKGSMLVNRYVELPDGRRIELVARIVPTCGTMPNGEKTEAAGRTARGRERSHLHH